MAQQTIQDASMQYAGNGAPNHERINGNFDELYSQARMVIVREVVITPGATVQRRIPLPCNFRPLKAVVGAESNAVTAGTATLEVNSQGVANTLVAAIDLTTIDTGAPIETVSVDFDPAPAADVDAGWYLGVKTISSNGDLTGLDGLTISILGVILPDSE